MPYRVTTEMPTDQNIMAVGREGEFEKAIDDIIARARPMKLLETGTYLALGTTAIIGTALKRHGVGPVEFYSVEISPQSFMVATINAQAQGLNVFIRHGLSVPRAILPSRDQIKKEIVDEEIDGVFVEYGPAQRADNYFAETNFGDVPEDLIGKIMERFEGKPDFMLLDSAGHLGFVEFQYAISKLRGPCIIALDDTRHVKHYKSLQVIKSDPRFRLLADSDEKFGFAIAEFRPEASGFQYAPEKPAVAPSASAMLQTLEKSVEKKAPPAAESPDKAPAVKAEPKKSEPKKPEPKKPEAKKPEPKKAEEKKPGATKKTKKDDK